MPSKIPHPPAPHNLRIPHQKLPPNPNPIPSPKPQRPLRLLHLLKLAHQPLHLVDPLHVRDALARPQGPAHAEQAVYAPTGLGVDGEGTTCAAAVGGDQRGVAEADYRD